MLLIASIYKAELSGIKEITGDINRGKGAIHRVRNHAANISATMLVQSARRRDGECHLRQLCRAEHGMEKLFFTRLTAAWSIRAG